MKIETIAKAEVHFVTTDEEDYYEYTRYSSTNWTVRMGESDEPVHNCEEIEGMFQSELELVKNKMTKERFKEIFENTESEWEGDNCFQGLQIIAKYTDHIVNGVGDDEVRSEDIDFLIEKGITEEDVKALAKLGWMIEGNSYLACFV